ncbi:MAG: hypothetical protein IPN32_28735 [Deltaproteobacteria bacterium]|nr:hypothetical protein [Deltaproteobacteria bacterium]
MQRSSTGPMLPCSRAVERILDLPEDLRLPHHQALEARGHAEDVARGIGGGPHERVLVQWRAVGALQLGEQRHHVMRQATAARHRVDLDAVAGRDHHRLGEVGPLAQALQHAGVVLVADRELLAQLDGRALVVQADRDDVAAHPRTP